MTSFPEAARFRAPPAFVLEPGKPVPADLCGRVLALGNFDGVHRGHAELARVAGEMAAPRCV